MKQCIFCKIVSGDIPSFKVYEDDVCMAYLDINPDSNGHTLIIPKEHYKDIYDIKEEVLLHIYKVAKNNVMPLLEEKLGCNGFTVLQNNGDIQEVKHYHLHIKPFYKGRCPITIMKNKELIDEVKDIYEKLKEA